MAAFFCSAMWIRDVVPTLVVYVTNVQQITSSATPITTSTIMLTQTVTSQTSQVVLTSFISVASVSTVSPLVMSLYPLSLTNLDTDVTISSPSSVILSSSTKSNTITTVSASTASMSSLTLGTATSTASAKDAIINSETSSSKLALAIALPIAAICVIGLIVFGLFLFRERLRKLTSSSMGNNDIPMRASVGPNKKEKVNYRMQPSNSNQVGSLKSRDYLNVRTTDAPERKADFAEQFEPSRKPNKPGLLSRLSRIVVPDLPMEFRSPMFLRRFNLLASERNAKPRADSVSQGVSLSDFPNKQLPVVPPLIYTYEARSTSGSLHDLLSTQTSEPLYQVVKPYVKRLSDELTVCVGEKVKIVKLHSDGWANVKMVSNEETGVIPLMSLRKCT